jgi:hypothetical protein
VVPVDTAQSVVEAEPSVLPAGVDAEVGGEPTAAAGMVGVTGRWGEEEGTPPSTSEGHCWMKLP